MIIMNKPRLAVPRALLLAALVVASLGCASSSGGAPTAAPDPVPPGSGSPLDPAAPDPGGTDPVADSGATGASEAPPVTGSRAGLIEALAESATSTAPPRPVTDDGTDSVTVASTPAPLAPGLRADLEEFGRWYLGYDHTWAPGRRAEALAPLVTETLLAEVAAPLPAALTAQLAAQQRVVTPRLETAEPIEAQADGSVVALLRFTVVTEALAPDAIDGDEPVTVEESMVLTVVVGPDGLVGDVR